MNVDDRLVHVIVVAYHASGDLDECLAVIGRETEVTVVDNSGSSDVHAVATRWNAKYIDPQRNVGFATAVNLGLRELQPDVCRDVVLLNPDASLTPDGMHRLLDFLHSDENKRVAAVSPRLVSYEGFDQRVAWPFPTPWRACVEAIGLGRTPARTFFVVGAVLLLRGEALCEVGLFDERFFLYAEEADWQNRALGLGWKSDVCLDVLASHRGAGTSSDPVRREILFHAGQETYIRKWFGSSGWLVYRSAACLGAALRAVVLQGNRRRVAARRALLYFRGPRRCAALAQDR